MSLPFLTHFGLTTKEADLYELLLRLGEKPAYDIIKESGLKRATAYKVLYTLESKGLASHKEIKKIIHFRPEAPSKLLELAERQFQSLEQAKNDLHGLLPKLTSDYIVSVEKPIVSTFEGVEGINTVFEDIYAPKKEPVYGCVDLETADVAVPALIAKKLIPKRIKNNVQAISFIANSPDARAIAKKDAQSLRKSRLLDKKLYPLPAEIDVYEDKVALLSFAKGQFAGVIIQNQDIATSLKSIFRFAFEHDDARKKSESPTD